MSENCQDPNNAAFRFVANSLLTLWRPWEQTFIPSGTPDGLCTRKVPLGYWSYPDLYLEVQKSKHNKINDSKSDLEEAKGDDPDQDSDLKSELSKLKKFKEKLDNSITSSTEIDDISE